MIEYSYKEEKIVALYFASLLDNLEAQRVLDSGVVTTSNEATTLSQFFWQMVDMSAQGNVKLPCEGSSQYWTEKLYNSLGGYLEKAGFEKEWNSEVDKA